MLVLSRIHQLLNKEIAITEIEQCLAASREVRDRIIRANMRLVFSIVKKFVASKHPFDELLSEGVVPLMRAVGNFDYDKGFRFSTYASRAIARDVHRSICTGTSKIFGSILRPPTISRISPAKIVHRLRTKKNGCRCERRCCD
jgi:RNA polymerase sigma factor (sigma-70 family)